MLFSSLTFIFLFLPLTLVGYWFCKRRDWARGRLAQAFLLTASLLFYGYWEWSYVPILVVSVLVNHRCGRALARRRRPFLLTLGVAANLALLGYFKYAHFFAANWNLAGGSELQVAQLALPLGISFYTFQQIAYLVDSHQQRIARTGLLDYALFVTFFPQLIAGPIVHHAEMMPQLATRGVRGPGAGDLAVGLTMFTGGLFKKVVLADQVAPYASSVFALADAGVPLHAMTAWQGALAYTVQIYFDFSGYSDMALGLGCLFGVRLPLNFQSPYQATNIIDFWRRWHITLSRFLRDYLYIPLGGGRRGPLRRYVNLMAVMLLGGLWHGAAWNFVLWGGLHGLYLLLNHAFRRWRSKSVAAMSRTPAARVLGQGLTQLAVVIAWVPFRATTFAGASVMWTAMLGGGAAEVSEADSTAGIALAAGLWLAAATLPNLAQLLRANGPSLDEPLVQEGRSARLKWTPNVRTALLVAAAAAVAIASLGNESEFLYFDF